MMPRLERDEVAAIGAKVPGGGLKRGLNPAETHDKAVFL
jgi:hypothetical protein